MTTAVTLIWTVMTIILALFVPESMDWPEPVDQQPVILVLLDLTVEDVRMETWVPVSSVNTDPIWTIAMPVRIVPKTVLLVRMEITVLLVRKDFSRKMVTVLPVRVHVSLVENQLITAPVVLNQIIL